jgi:hypothetical protein
MTFPIDLTASVMDAALWWAIGGSVTTAVLLDLLVAVSWSLHVLTTLMGDTR